MFVSNYFGDYSLFFDVLGEFEGDGGVFFDIDSEGKTVEN